MKFVEPNDGHVLKAIAWDALYAGLYAEGNTASLDMLDSVLEKVGTKLSNPMTWENDMASKYESKDRYYCRACRHAEPKGDWKLIKLANAPFWICPYCGAIVDVSIANVMPEDEPEPDDTIPNAMAAMVVDTVAVEAAKKKKAAAAKKRREAKKKAAPK